MSDDCVEARDCHVVEAWAELADCMDGAHLALQALMDLAAAVPADVRVGVQALHALLLGPHGQLLQAHAALRLLAGRVPHSPPAPARPCSTCCRHDAQGLVEGT